MIFFEINAILHIVPRSGLLKACRCNWHTTQIFSLFSFPWRNVGKTPNPDDKMAPWFSPRKLYMDIISIFPVSKISTFWIIAIIKIITQDWKKMLFFSLAVFEFLVFLYIWFFVIPDVANKFNQASLGEKRTGRSISQYLKQRNANYVIANQGSVNRKGNFALTCWRKALRTRPTCREYNKRSTDQAVDAVLNDLPEAVPLFSFYSYHR